LRRGSYRNGRANGVKAFEINDLNDSAPGGGCRNLWAIANTRPAVPS